mgnify:CR=1 FL=1
MNINPLPNPAPADHFFDGFRAPKSIKAKEMVAEIVNQIENYEKYLSLRKRKRRPVDQVIFETTVAAVICDVIHHHLSGHAGKVAISRSHRKLAVKSRYRSMAEGSTLPVILDRLSAAEMAFLTKIDGYRELQWTVESEGQASKAYWKGTATVLGVGARLLTRINDLNLGLDDFTRSDDEEVIILKGHKGPRGQDAAREAYDDTPTIDCYRKEVRQINSWLEAAKIEDGADVQRQIL